MNKKLYTISLGKKMPHTKGPLRHKKDFHQEVLVDFSAGSGGTLGFLTVFHDFTNPSRKAVYFIALIDDKLVPAKEACLSTGKPIMPDIGEYSTTNEALNGVDKFFLRYLKEVSCL